MFKFECISRNNLVTTDFSVFYCNYELSEQHTYVGNFIGIRDAQKFKSFSFANKINQFPIKFKHTHVLRRNKECIESAENKGQHIISAFYFQSPRGNFTGKPI